MDKGAIITAAGAVAAAGLGGYMVFVEPFRIRVRELELAFPNLPAAFDGYEILHLSDLHLTKLGLLERKTMDIIRSREVDCCVITGDVTAQPRASDVFRRVCSAIRSRGLIYAVLGNSEHKPWLDTPTLVDALTFDGLAMLVNSSSVIRRGAEFITVVGVDDPYSHLDDVDAAFAGVDPDGFVLFLTHAPSCAPQALERGADLLLAGHTHGGQVRLPVIGTVFTHMRSNHALNDGLYSPSDLSKILDRTVEHAVLFVNRGTGTSRLHIRLLCPPEVAFITLRRGIGSQ